MSSTLNTLFLTTRVINNCSIVYSSKLDRTFKALINSYKSREELAIVDYLNKLRIIYYIKRLEYRDSKKARELKG